MERLRIIKRYFQPVYSAVLVHKELQEVLIGHIEYRVLPVDAIYIMHCDSIRLPERLRE